MLSPYTQDQILAITRINGFKIYTVFEKINHWVDNYLRNWAVCSENYPLMSLPMHLDTQDQETVNQHLYWQARGSVLKRRRGGSNNKSEQTRNEERSDDSWCQSTADLESVQFSQFSLFLLNTNNINTHSVKWFWTTPKVMFWTGYVSKWDTGRYITYAHRHNWWQQTNSCTLQKQSNLFIDLYYQHYTTA